MTPSITNLKVTYHSLRSSNCRTPARPFPAYSRPKILMAYSVSRRNCSRSGQRTTNQVCYCISGMLNGIEPHLTFLKNVLLPVQRSTIITMSTFNWLCRPYHFACRSTIQTRSLSNNNNDGHMVSSATGCSTSVAPSAVSRCNYSPYSIRHLFHLLMTGDSCRSQQRAKM